MRRLDLKELIFGERVCRYSYRSESCGQTLNKISFSSMLHFNFRSMNRASMDFSSGFKNYRRFLLLNLVFGYRATPKLAFDL